MPLGICTSSGAFGHSFSFGRPTAWLFFPGRRPGRRGGYRGLQPRFLGGRHAGSPSFGRSSRGCPASSLSSAINSRAGAGGIHFPVTLMVMPTRNLLYVITKLELAELKLSFLCLPADRQEGVSPSAGRFSRGPQRRFLFA